MAPHVAEAQLKAFLHSDDKDEPLVDLLMSLYDEVGAESFETVTALVKFRKTPNRPRFPAGIVVKNMPSVPEDQVEAFKAKHIDSSYIHDYGSPEALARMGKGVQQVRDLQYKRWKWCLDNIETYVDMLRVSGHSDEAIQAMIEGRPLCMPDAALFAEMEASLKQLKPLLEADMVWTNVGFVFTGSSVAGFSQNPLKGREFEPTKITSKDKSDVDICIKANGVDSFMEELREQGCKIRGFPTTCSPHTGGMRYGVKGDVGTLVSKNLGQWYNEWAAKLPGGLQITFCEDALDIPAWEGRINTI